MSSSEETLLDLLPTDLIKIILLYSDNLENLNVDLDLYFWKNKIDIDLPLIQFGDELKVNLWKLNEDKIKMYQSYQLIVNSYNNYINILNKNYRKINFKSKIIDLKYLNYLNLSKFDLYVVNNILTKQSVKIILSLYDCSTHNLNESVNVNIILKWKMEDVEIINQASAIMTEMTKIDLINFLMSCNIKKMLH